MQQKFIKVKITNEIREGAFAIDSIFLIMPNSDNKKQSIIRFHNGSIEAIDEPFHDLVSRLNGFNVN